MDKLQENLDNAETNNSNCEKLYDIQMITPSITEIVYNFIKSKLTAPDRA